MGKVTHDIGCSNKACVAPEMRKDVRAERLSDGQLAVLDGTGREVIEPICDTCGSLLTIRFVSFAIVGRAEKALDEKRSDGKGERGCANDDCGTRGSADEGCITPDDLPHFFPNGPSGLVPTNFTVPDDGGRPTLELTDRQSGTVLEADLARVGVRSDVDGNPTVAMLGFKPTTVKVPADGIN